MAVFEAKLGVLGWSKGELCRRLGLHRNTVTRWCEAPGYVEAYLDLAVAFRAYRVRVKELAGEINAVSDKED